MMQNLTPRQQMQENGYVIFKDVLTPAEIETIRNDVRNFFQTDGRFLDFGKTQPDAFAKVPQIRWVATHPKILAAFKAATEIDDLRYTFHSDIHMNVLGGWHTDTQRYFAPKEVLVDDFQVFKVGIYLQDHLENAQGLTVCEGSHVTGVINNSKVKPIHTRAGDIIVFDVRILHHGDMKSFIERVIGKVLKDDKLKYRLNSSMRSLRNRKDKLSLFFTYGVNNNLTREFSVRNMARQNQQNGIDKGIESDETMIELLRKNGVSTI